MPGEWHLFAVVLTHAAGFGEAFGPSQTQRVPQLVAATAPKTLQRNSREQHKRCRCAPLDPFLGLHFRNVLGDALCEERRLAHRLSRVTQGPRDIVFVPNWFTNCEVVPELPSVQGWVEAMTSLGRLIFFDQPGTGASDPVTPGAPPNLEQWADSITAVFDELGAAKRSSSRSRRVRGSGPVRGDSIRPAQPRWSGSRAMRIRWLNAPMGSLPRKFSLPSSPCGARGVPT